MSFTFGNNIEDEMKEAEYATEKHAMVNVILSSLIMGGYVFYLLESGYINVWRVMTVFFVTAMCIWMPDTVAGLKNDLVSAKTIRVGGWITLLIIVIYPYLLRTIFR